MIDRYMNKQEIAERIGCTTRHVDSLVAKRMIPATKVGKLIRFDWARVQSALNKFTRCAIGEE